MKKILVVLVFLLCFVGCIETNTNRVEDISYETYVFEVHTVGGVCDTVITNSKPREFLTDGNLRLIFDDVEYSFVDKFREIEEK